jgi:hypothetical protein
MKIIYLLLLVIFSSMLRGQEDSVGINTNHQNQVFLSKVKLIDEFVERFNGNYSQFSASFDSLSRLEKVKRLIEHAYYHEQSAMLDSFLTHIINDQYFIVMSKKYWCAELNVSFVYNKSRESVFLYMQYEVDEKNRAKWVIKGAFLPFLKEIQGRRDEKVFINPVNNETNFSEFSQLLKDNKAYSLTPNGFFNDHLSVFLFLISQKMLMFNQVNEIKYVFHTGQYRFEVSEFNRNSFNSGWLISKVNKDKSFFPIHNSIDMEIHNQMIFNNELIEKIKLRFE